MPRIKISSKSTFDFFFRKLGTINGSEGKGREEKGREMVKGNKEEDYSAYVLENYLLVTFHSFHSSTRLEIGSKICLLCDSFNDFSIFICWFWFR